MKSLLLALSLSAALLPVSYSNASSSDVVCGTVFIGQQCDVDYCLIGLAFTNAQGQHDRYSLADGGQVFNRDYTITPQLEAMNGKNYCATKPANGFGIIDINDLVPQK